MWTYQVIRNQIKKVDDIQFQINRVDLQISSLKSKQMLVPTLTEKLAINAKITCLRSTSSRLKINYVAIKGEVDSNV